MSVSFSEDKRGNTRDQENNPDQESKPEHQHRPTQTDDRSVHSIRHKVSHKKHIIIMDVLP